MKDILQLALDGKLSEEQAIEYLNNVCDDENLVREIVEKVASASIINPKLKTASGIIDWIKNKCKGNKALLSGVVALMLSSGVLHGYEIQKGDTLWKLGGGTAQGVSNILAINPTLKADTVLPLGMKIALPGEAKQVTEYTVVKGDTFSGIAKKLGMSLKDLIALNPQVKDINKLSIGQKLNISSQHSTIQQVAPSKAKTTKVDSKIDANTDFVARVIYAESGNSVEEMEMIAHLIVNRMKSGMFPSTAIGVVTQKNQFSCATGKDGNVKWKNYSRNLNEMTKKAYELAEKAVKGDASGMKGSDTALFYCTKSLAKNGVGKGTTGLTKEYGHPSGWGSYSTFTPVETSKNHVFYDCKKA